MRACGLVWASVKEMSEVTSSNPLRGAAHDPDQIDPAAALPRPRITGPSDGTRW